MFRTLETISQFSHHTYFLVSSLPHSCSCSPFFCSTTKVLEVHIHPHTTLPFFVFVPYHAWPRSCFRFFSCFKCFARKARFWRYTSVPTPLVHLLLLFPATPGHARGSFFVRFLRSCLKIKVLEVMHKFDCVSLFLSGHRHRETYFEDANGIHHVSLAAALEAPPGEVRGSLPFLFLSGGGRRWWTMPLK